LRLTLCCWSTSSWLIVLTLRCLAGIPMSFWSSALCLSSSGTPTSDTYTLSLHDALPICPSRGSRWCSLTAPDPAGHRCHNRTTRSEEHTSELQSRVDLVCRLLLEKKKPRDAYRHCGRSGRPSVRLNWDSMEDRLPWSRTH